MSWSFVVSWDGERESLIPVPRGSQDGSESELDEDAEEEGEGEDEGTGDEEMDF